MCSFAILYGDFSRYAKAENRLKWLILCQFLLLFGAVIEISLVTAELILVCTVLLGFLLSFWDKKIVESIHAKATDMTIGSLTRFFVLKRFRVLLVLWLLMLFCSQLSSQMNFAVLAHHHELLSRYSINSGLAYFGGMLMLLLLLKTGFSRYKMIILGYLSWIQLTSAYFMTSSAAKKTSSLSSTTTYNAYGSPQSVLGPNGMKNYSQTIPMWIDPNLSSDSWTGNLVSLTVGYSMPSGSTNAVGQAITINESSVKRGVSLASFQAVVPQSCTNLPLSHHCIEEIIAKNTYKNKVSSQYNKLGQMISMAKISPNASTYSSTSLIQTNQYYDPMGQMIAGSVPFLEGGSPKSFLVNLLSPTTGQSVCKGQMNVLSGSSITGFSIFANSPCQYDFTAPAFY